MAHPEAVGPVFVVGAGRLGSALGALLARGGIEVAGLWSRGRGSADAAQRLTGLPCTHGAFPPVIGSARTVLLAVHDNAVPTVAGALLDAGLFRSAATVLHCGGARSAAEALAALDRSSCSRGTLHPLVALAHAEQAMSCLPGAHFAVEGEAPARRVAEALVRAVGGRSFELDPGRMALYHAAAVLASNHPVALWASALQLLQDAGMPREAALEALVALVRSTVENMARLGLPEALTGPIRRGDLKTVSRHLEVLESRPDGIADLYRACSLQTAEVARTAEPERAALLAAIRKMLAGG